MDRYLIAKVFGRLRETETADDELVLRYIREINDDLAREGFNWMSFLQTLLELGSPERPVYPRSYPRGFHGC